MIHTQHHQHVRYHHPKLAMIVTRAVRNYSNVCTIVRHVVISFSIIVDKVRAVFVQFVSNNNDIDVDIINNKINKISYPVLISNRHFFFLLLLHLYDFSFFVRFFFSSFYLLGEAYVTVMCKKKKNNFSVQFFSFDLIENNKL